MKKTLFTLLTLVCGATANYAQNMSEICGTRDWHILDQRLDENREAMESGRYKGTERMTKYIPIKFHLIAKLDGTGRLSEAKVFENLCQLNIDYQDQNIIFYMADGSINYINDNNAYNDQSNTLGSAVLEKNRSKSAINIFFAQTTPSNGSLGGTTLGYYSPIKDWLVIRNDQVNNTSGTLSHELGHCFSLKHPFSGWDQESYLQKYGNGSSWTSIPTWFKTPVTVAPDGATLIECFNGSNCKVAGDKVCDTPADYNFGFGWDGCNPFNRKIIGPCAQDSIKDVNENLFMAYFIGCKNYVFTTEQKALIAADYNSTRRAYIRPNYTPAIETITQQATNLTPNDIALTVLYYDYVTLDWDNVPGADAYLIEIDQQSSFTSSTVQRYFTNTSNFIATKLAANKGYYWRVIPFDTEGGTCQPLSGATKARFRTSSFTVGTSDIKLLNSWGVSPNPTAAGTDLVLNMDAVNGFDASIAIYNALGQEVKSLGSQNIIAGMNSFNISTDNLTPGMYTVRIQSAKGTESKKVVINR